jgi:hypothetical protein
MVVRRLRAAVEQPRNSAAQLHERYDGRPGQSNRLIGKSVVSVISVMTDITDRNIEVVKPMINQAASDQVV